MPLFQGLTGCDMTLLLGHAHEKTIQRTESFFHAGDAAARCFLLLEGHLKLGQITPAGEQGAARLIAAGDIFGWAGLMDDHSYPGTAEALTACRALWWETERMRQTLLATPHLALRLLALLGRRLREAESRLLDLATVRVEQRLAKALLRQPADLPLPLTRQDLAELCGTTLYTVSRTLRAWEQAGWLRLGRGSLRVLSPPALAALIQGPDAS